MSVMPASACGELSTRDGWALVALLSLVELCLLHGQTNALGNAMLRITCQHPQLSDLLQPLLNVGRAKRTAWLHREREYGCGQHQAANEQIVHFESDLMVEEQLHLVSSRNGECLMMGLIWSNAGFTSSSPVARCHIAANAVSNAALFVMECSLGTRILVTASKTHLRDLSLGHNVTQGGSQRIFLNDNVWNVTNSSRPLNDNVQDITRCER